MVGSPEEHIVESWHEWLLDGRERKVVLVISTSLQLEPGEEGFSPDRIDELVEEAMRRMQASASPIDAVRIVPAT